MRITQCKCMECDNFGTDDCMLFVPGKENCDNYKKEDDVNVKCDSEV